MVVGYIHGENFVTLQAYESAKKDNDFIYHERIPDLKSLPAIQKAAVAKALTPSSPMFPRFKGKLCSVSDQM